MKKHLYLVFLLFSIFGYSQTTISGKITDTSGEPLIGATVLEKGTTNGVVSDFNGNYELTVADGSTIVVSYTGFANMLNTQYYLEYDAFGFGWRGRPATFGATVGFDF